MDIDRVRYFHAFAATGSLVAASEILGISQPALSKALKLLESEVGAKLLSADGRGLRLTAAGVSFKQKSGPLLEQWMALPTKLSQGQIEIPTRIGSFEVFTTYFLATLTKYIGLENLELYEFGPGRLEDAIANGTIDLGITYAPVPKPQIEFIEVAKVKMGVFGVKKLKTEPIGNVPFVVPLQPLEGAPSKVIGLDGWPDHRYTRLIKYKVTLMQSAIELCGLGLCVAYLPSFVVALHNKGACDERQLVEANCPLPLKERQQSVFLIQRKNSPETALHRQIAKALRSL